MNRSAKAPRRTCIVHSPDLILRPAMFTGLVEAIGSQSRCRSHRTEHLRANAEQRSRP